MKYMELTLYQDSASSQECNLFVNVEHIASFHFESEGKTAMTMSNGNIIYIRESREEILMKVKML